MAFTVEKLESNVDFSTADTKNPPKWIEGKGQRVHWSNCYVTRYETDSKGNRGEGIEVPEREGSMTVPANIEMYFGGEGKLKEG